MPDAWVEIKQHERTPVYGEVDVASGTGTISQAPTWSLYDSAGALVGSLTAQAVTGYDGTAGANLKAWINFAPLTYSLEPGIYTLVFLIYVTGTTDSISRKEEPAVLIVIWPDYS